ncbi:putative transcription factor [Podospora fimiseda]|uniref:Transcription factor n=1 Tax=Podospora fimiseda TaxID=252190 RepID=A0AAN7BGZ3_9PEZI|nr:putative transcription factor [Podospora fimiseda]
MRKRACDACHRRKIQCDGAQPSCDWCKHHNLECTFDREVRTRKKATTRGTPRQVFFWSSCAGGPDDTTASPENLTHRLQGIEDLLSRQNNGYFDGVHVQGQQQQQQVAQLHHGPGPSSQSPISAAAVSPPAVDLLSLVNVNTPALSPPALAEQTPGNPNPSETSCFGKLHFAGYHLGNISSYNGVPHFTESGRQWIRSRTGQDPNFPPLWKDAGTRQYYPSSQTPGEPFLPDRYVVEEYLRFFSTSHFRLVFPLIDCLLFRQTIDAAYEHVVNAKACVFAFLSVVTLFLENDRRPAAPPVDGDTMAARAEYLLPSALQEFNLNSLQTVLMLSMYQLFSGRIQSSIIFHSLSCRINFMLGGHTLPNPWSPSHAQATPPDVLRTQRHLRKLFWLTYFFDKEISLRTGQPPAIVDEHCDLSIPPGYSQAQYLDKYLYLDASSFSSEVDETTIPILPGDLRLALIKSKTCRLLYSAEALRKSDAELLRNIRELDSELESWRLSIPEKHRPILSGLASEKRQEKVNASLQDVPDSVRAIVINLEYHYLVATIHRATSRCSTWTRTRTNLGLGIMGEIGAGEKTRETIRGVSSSLTLSVEASRSTLLFLRTAVPAFLTHAFCMMLFYPMSAMVTIFCSILLDPLGENAVDDLKLLDAAPELINAIRIRQLTQNETVHLRLVDEFVTELSRLCHCAISEAKTKRALEYGPASGYHHPS